VVRSRFAQFAWAVLGFNLLVILWGALVRASRSGEGCGDHWPLCNGTVIPHAAEIATLIEFTHRATTGIAFFSVVAMAIWAFRSYRSKPIFKSAIASLVLIVTEALLGAGLVLFRYTGTNASAGRAIYLSAHLINTLAMLAAMTLTAWWASGRRRIEWGKPEAPLLGWAIAAALLIAVTGAVTALSDTLFPDTSLSAGIAADLSAASPMLVRLRVLHPAIAAAAGIFIAIVAGRFRRESRFAQAVISLVVIQMAAGALNLLLLAPVWMQIVHLLLADLLWIALILFSASLLEQSPARDRSPALAYH
jgi:heme a synthase